MNSYFTKKRTWQPLIALIILITGFLLLIYMIIVEDEPGAIPLILILSGLGWITKIRLKKKKNLIGDQK
ncbi:MAG TPA: hypothetical protein VKM37_03005 [Balneolaceae bacterium]|nr:hypothetical protein [Balneolaceae bacterium]